MRRPTEDDYIEEGYENGNGDIEDYVDRLNNYIDYIENKLRTLQKRNQENIDIVITE